MKMKQDICKISDIIAKKTVRRDSLYDRYHGVSTEETILSNLNMALDELNLRNVKVENGGWFGEKLDRKSLNYKKLHGSKSLGEEKRILRDIKIQQKDVSSFKSLEVLNKSLWGKHYIYHGWEKLVREIEQFQNQPMERASKYDNLKKTIKVKIKIHDYYQYCSLIDKVHQLAEEKDVAALEEMSSSEGGKFMLEWNNNKAFRQDYETKVLRSLEGRQLSRDGRRRPDKSCC
ncbi:putative proton pump interactor [Trifolium pratense]|uniref:Putative proton pump interactor n=1 Tax=Trifolium pratense TaxID=57577 RepID=A0A2K3LC69_TRIPR|nr:putative proton pump interactor [Trifolium pratense]